MQRDCKNKCLNSRYVSPGDVVRQVDEYFFQKTAVVGWKLVNFLFQLGYTVTGVKIFQGKNGFPYCN